MGKVTYLFGAGASAKCLPIVKDMNERIQKFRAFMQENASRSNQKIYEMSKETRQDIEKQFQVDCLDLAEGVTEHQSIDTYAKKLFLTEDSRYTSVKAILTVFFIYEQLSQPVDIRYDSFFASLLKSHSTDFPEEIKILSWNYDFQFEMAYRKYSRNNSLRENQLSLHVCPDGLRPADVGNGFAIFKINGTTSTFNKAEQSLEIISDDLTLRDKNKIRDALVKSYYDMCIASAVMPMLSFAWEPPSEKNAGLLEKACESIRASEVLVTIGYSFPFFNREIDRQLLAAIANKNKIKIYVQDKKPKLIIDRLSSVIPPEVGREVIPIDDIDQFYMPPEL